MKRGPRPDLFTTFGAVPAPLPTARPGKKRRPGIAVLLRCRCGAQWGPTTGRDESAAMSSYWQHAHGCAKAVVIERYSGKRGRWTDR